jgi:hypothetical protein
VELRCLKSVAADSPEQLAIGRLCSTDIYGPGNKQCLQQQHC